MKEETKRNGITLPYKVILKKMWGASYVGKISIRDFRRILVVYFRMGKQSCNRIYIEMKELGYISRCGSRGYEVQIDTPLKDLV